MAAGLPDVRSEIAPKRRDVRYIVRMDFVVDVHRKGWIYKNRGGRANGEWVW